jgi:hypothetical protein
LRYRFSVRLWLGPFYDRSQIHREENNVSDDHSDTARQITNSHPTSIAAHHQYESNFVFITDLPNREKSEHHSDPIDAIVLKVLHVIFSFCNKANNHSLILAVGNKNFSLSIAH